MLLRLPDPERRFAAVRLCSDLPLDGALAHDDGEWRLELDIDGLERLEYEFEVRDDGGDRARIRDPGNPETAPGAFGEKSVLLLPRYAAPAWLDAERVDGATQRLAVPGRGLGAEVPIGIWSPADAEPGEPLPLLVAHDGPEYDALSRLTDFAAAAIAAGALPRHRVGLLGPGDRNEWYSASARYAGALARDVLPAIRATVATRGPVVGMGASLGGLAMLHAQRRHAGSLDALFLQSSSFFMPRFDAHESGFPRYQRIVRWVRAVVRGRDGGEPVPTVLTCGRREENIDNNRVMARTLGAPLRELGDTHNYTAWRDAFEPHLTQLLARVW